MMDITVTIPESYAGAVMGDVSASRGRVTGMDTNKQGDTVVNATVPYAELVDYATRLRSLTRGTGDFTMEPAGYEQDTCPCDVQKRLVAFSSTPARRVARAALSLPLAAPAVLPPVR